MATGTENLFRIEKKAENAVSFIYLLDLNVRQVIQNNFDQDSDDYRRAVQLTDILREIGVHESHLSAEALRFRQSVYQGILDAQGIQATEAGMVDFYNSTDLTQQCPPEKMTVDNERHSDSCPPGSIGYYEYYAQQAANLGEGERAELFQFAVQQSFEQNLPVVKFRGQDITPLDMWQYMSGLYGSCFKPTEMITMDIFIDFLKTSFGEDEEIQIALPPRKPR